jgi:hypothetical protein
MIKAFPHQYAYIRFYNLLFPPEGWRGIPQQLATGQASATSPGSTASRHGWLLGHFSGMVPGTKAHHITGTIASQQHRKCAVA